MQNENPGVLLDTRPPEEKEKDYKFEELVSSTAPVTWREKKQSEWRHFPTSDQNGSGSCVAQTLKKMLGVYIWVKTGVWVALSASHIYQRRANRPNPGMGGTDAFKIGQKGVTLESFAPSENMSDSQMDSVVVKPFMEEVGKVFSIGKFLEVSPKNIDTVASIIQTTDKAVMTWFYFSTGLKPREWKAIPEVKHTTLPLSGPNTSRHSIATVDFTLLGKSNLPNHKQHWGKKALIADESWGLDKDVLETGKITDTIITVNGQHIITEDWFKARNFFVGYFMNFLFEDKAVPEVDPDEGAKRPHHNFTRDLEFVPTFTTDADVVALQNILKYEGLFPANTDSTGWYGAVTKKAVEGLQLKHGIADTTSAGFGRVGPKTRAWLNSNYN